MEELSRAADTINISEIAYNGQAEQGVEFDYVLPDYYPDIFRILSCTLTPRIVSHSITNDNKLILDGVVYIKVLYLAENSNAVHCIENRYTYSKTVEIGKKNGQTCHTPQVSLTPQTDYCNCRAVSNRRIDVRGAVSTKIRIICDSSFTLPEINNTLQVKTRDITCCDKELTANKQFTVREEIDTGAAGISYIVSCNAVPKLSDLRIIADKAVIKGTVTVSALYGLHDPNASGCTDMDHMTADIPISQIIDIIGISDEYTSVPEISVMNCELSCREDSGILSCELLLSCSIKASKEHTVFIPIDAYSTEFETEKHSSIIKAATNQRKFEHCIDLHCNIGAGSDTFEAVWDCIGELSNVTCRIKSENELLITGQLCCRAIGKLTGGVPCWIEKQEAFEEIIPVSITSQDPMIDHSAIISDIGYSIKTDGTLDISTKINCCMMMKDLIQLEVLSAITILEDKPKSKDTDFAMRICYANGTEDCWSIAKRYNTTVSAIMRDNDLDDATSPLNGMVLIPTV